MVRVGKTATQIMSASWCLVGGAVRTGCVVTGCVVGVRDMVSPLSDG